MPARHPRPVPPDMSGVPPIEWRPPVLKAKVGRRGWWRYRLTPVMDRPGEWGMVHTTEGDKRHAQQLASRLRQRNGIDYPSGRWEFTHDEETGEVFARYLGPTEEA